MKKQTLIILLLITALAIVVGNISYQNNSGSSVVAQSQLIAALAPDLDLDNVSKVSIATQDNNDAITLEKRLGEWQVLQKNGYPADVEKLSKLLQAVNQAHIVEAKTAMAKHHHRLQLKDFADGDSKAIRLQVTTPAAELELYVGLKASSGEGQYVRLVGDPQTYLIDQNLRLTTDTTKWLEPKIIDLEFNQVRSVKVTHHDDEEYQIKRDVVETTETTESSDVDNQPEDLESVAKQAVEQAASVLKPDVQDDVKGANGGNTKTYELANHFTLNDSGDDEELQYPSILDGLVRNILGLKLVDVFQHEEQDTGKLSHTFAISYVAASDDDDADERVGPNQQLQNQVLQLFVRESEADDKQYFARLNDSSWVYEVSSSSFKQIAKSRSDFVHSDEDEE